jgi:misacylated tRNA(Ala) deacylase
MSKAIAMPTDCQFREDSYLKECDATVVAIEGNGGIVLDRTVFYAASGGQPADPGILTTASGAAIPVAGVVFTDPGKTTIAHVPPPGAPAVTVGDTIKAAIDWRIRHARMRMHTALHLLSAVLPYPVTGGSVGDAESRLDFDIPEAGLDLQPCGGTHVRSTAEIGAVRVTQVEKKGKLNRRVRLALV